MRAARLRLAACLGGLWLLAPLPARAAGTFYVDNSSASCSNGGPGTEAQPYCTISAAVAAHQGPGTTILVKPGTYREQVTITASGTAGSPFVLQALGGPVIVDGTDDVSSQSSWVQYSDNVYLATSVTWSPMQVFMDGARLVPSTAAPTALPDQSFTWVSGQGLFVNAGGGSPAEHELLVGRRPYGFYAAARSYLTIDGFTVTRADNRCLQFIDGCTNVIVSHNVVNFAFRYGIQAIGGSAFLIDSNVVSDNDDHGIMCLSGVTASTIQNNESFRNARLTERAANGIHLFACPANRIQNNRAHDNQDTGIQVESGSNNCLLIQNRSWNNGDHGYDHVYSTGITHLGDVAFGNHKDGFSIEGNATGTVLYNCIAVDNGLTTNEFDLWVDPSSTTGFESDYNLFWNSTSQPPFKYISTQFSTLSAYRAASGEDAHSIQADPAFLNPWSGDFHLVTGSPAIDAANSGVPNWPATDAEGNARFDDPSTPNTGVGPVAYADLGALEFQNTQVVVRPTAALVVTPAVGLDPQRVTADASGSSDSDGTIVSYRFDFGDGAIAGPQSSPIATHDYTAGNWIATVIVTDNDGAAQSASAPVTVKMGATGGNLVANPSFEQDLSGWTAFDGCTLSRVPGGYDGNWALQMNATGTVKSSFGVNDHPDWVHNVLAAGIDYRFTAWVRSAGNNGKAVIAVREYLLSNGQLVGSALSDGLSLSSEWRMITLDYLTASSGTTLDFQVKEYPVNFGEVFLADNISIVIIPPVAGVVGPGPGALSPLVYPSPFRSTATLRFATSKPGRLRVDIFDLAGRRVRCLIDEPAAPAGVHQLGIAREGGGGASRFDPGIYFYRVDAPEGVRTGRFVVLR